MTVYEVFAKNVKKILADNGLSQADLARALNSTPQQVSQTLSLKYEPSLTTVEAYADALGVTVSHLLSEKNPKPVKIKKIEADFSVALEIVAKELKKIEKLLSHEFGDYDYIVRDFETRINHLEQKMQEVNPNF